MRVQESRSFKIIKSGTIPFSSLCQDRVQPSARLWCQPVDRHVTYWTTWCLTHSGRTRNSHKIVDVCAWIRTLAASLGHTSRWFWLEDRTNSNGQPVVVRQQKRAVVVWKLTEICTCFVSASYTLVSISQHCAPDFAIFTRATRSIARYLLRQCGWLGGWLSHAGIVSKRLNLS